ncbi:PaaX family transcriptional regulator [Geodermatophilus marinus]|uniref:PaaX family transcriptional regulator n=1 Tax=Geodermatophilus sp. LHW52908 TaxID=2303986 RepID=UPI000E3E5140|nr:PaaX family transcriptional regulator C-terminal domain-containing protein [Geodermatophilus sp. LHW52908]RFU21229.1 PaaX family transcriptional regulator [Geodermatophilus sp. LHW52908]
MSAVPSDDLAEDEGPLAPHPARPQTHVLLFCGVHLTDPALAVPTAGLVDVLGRVGVGEYAARSTVSRMLRRGTLERRRSGRRVLLSPSGRARAELAEGGERAWRSPVNRTWDGEWTLLAFSLPETRRADRHLLRSRLQWAGFGMLRDGMWVAPREVDVPALLARVDVLDSLKVFRARVVEPTEVAELVDDAWDLATLARRYARFLDRWDRPDPLPDASDDLARQLHLLGEWTLLARADPGLPVEHLPADWPAVRAEHVALRLRRRYAAGAGRAVADLVERVRTVDERRGSG